jgi:hypothetical protein
MAMALAACRGVLGEVKVESLANVDAILFSSHAPFPSAPMNRLPEFNFNPLLE